MTFRLLRKPYLLLLVLMPYLVSIMGVTAYFCAHQYRHFFQQLISGTEEDDLELLKFTDDEFQSITWTERNREFSRDGKMYDVSKIIETKEGWEVYCEHDAFEDAVIAWMKVNAEKAKSKSDTGSGYVVLAPIMESNFAPDSTTPVYFDRSSTYASRHVELHTPPPRL